MNLLNVDANAKTVKGQKVGYLTGVLYLAPYDVSGINVCAMSELAGCQKTCLFVQGRAGVSAGVCHRGGTACPARIFCGLRHGVHCRILSLEGIRP